MEIGHRASLAGVVKDDGGRRVAGATVTCHQSGDVRQTQSSDDGTFWFEDLNGGKYEIAVEAGRTLERRRGSVKGNLPVRSKQSGPPPWIEVTVSA
jgi:hypothetical protein